ncbi:MAG: hypothetical protein ABSB59_34530 [Streptosporangiaceae bacterium]|jgi:hypothetical protein
MTSHHLRSPRATTARATTARATTARAAILCSGLICSGLVACSSPPPPAFDPGGPASTASATAVAQSSGPGSVVMPPFGQNTHVVMTGFLPKDAEMARAAVADKDYELAFLYAEYTGGQSDDWAAYVNRTMEIQVRALLAKPDVTTESFKGTIKIFDLRVIRDPIVPGNLDVSACFDNAKAVNTDLKSGAVLSGQSVSDTNYYRFTDELAKSSDGQWQVISNYPIVYYPQAKECKP